MSVTIKDTTGKWCKKKKKNPHSPPPPPKKNRGKLKPKFVNLRNYKMKDDNKVPKFTQLKSTNCSATTRQHCRLLHVILEILNYTYITFVWHKFYGVLTQTYIKFFEIHGIPVNCVYTTCTYLYVFTQQFFIFISWYCKAPL